MSSTIWSGVLHCLPVRGQTAVHTAQFLLLFEPPVAHYNSLLCPVHALIFSHESSSAVSRLISPPPLSKLLGIPFFHNYIFFCHPYPDLCTVSFSWFRAIE
ncbi:unnamed protein product [Choristocarpus tenellus]